MFESRPYYQNLERKYENVAKHRISHDGQSAIPSKITFACNEGEQILIRQILPNITQKYGGNWKQGNLLNPGYRAYTHIKKGTVDVNETHDYQNMVVDNISMAVEGAASLDIILYGTCKASHISG